MDCTGMEKEAAGIDFRPEVMAANVCPDWWKAMLK